MVTELDCLVNIGGSDKSSYVSSIEIERDICRIAATCRLELDPDAYSGIESWDELEIWQQGIKRFTGYVDEVTKERMPAACVVVGTDNLKRANLYLIDEEIVSNGESLEYWVNYLLGLAGLGSAATSGSTGKTVPADYLFQYQFAADYLQMIAAYAGWVLYADGWGTVHFKKPEYSIPSHEISASALTKSEFERSRDRMWIRNRAVIFGVGDVRADVTRVNRYLPGESIAAAVASPEWDTVAKAEATANEMLDEYNDPLDLKWATIPGDATYELADTVNLGDLFTGLGVGRAYRALVTSIRSRMSADGYTMRIGLDEKCPRIWGWGRYMPSMGSEWLSLDGGGVYRYDYSSLSWVNTSGSLAGDALYVREVEADLLENDIAWIATLDGIYKYLYSQWQKQGLPNPVNDAGDSPAPTYADLDFVAIEVIDSDYVVATARHKSLNRGWLYNFSESTWASYQLAIGASYDVKPMQGPQALYLPETGTAYITANDGSTRRLIRWSAGSFSVPYSTSGSPFEVAGPWSTPDTIYLFGNPTPVLLKSANGGDSQTDIAPGSNPLRPVLPLPWREDDLLVVDSANSVLYRDVDAWATTGSSPITPRCGMRSRYGGVQVLLGQKQAGDTYKVAFSPNSGSTWQDMGAGLPDISVTSISGLEGTGGAPIRPEIETCTELVQAWTGYHWSSWYPLLWSYTNLKFGHYYFRKAMRGQRITSWEVTNCVDLGSTVNFWVEIYLYSPWDIYLGGSLGLRPTLWYKTASTQEELTGAPIPREDVTLAYLWSGKYFDLGDGNYKLIYTGLSVTDSEPYMAFSLMTMHNDYREASQAQITEGEFECLTNGYTSRQRGWLGESSYDSLDFFSLQGEFNYHYGRVYDGHQLDLGNHLGTCEVPSTGFQYDLWDPIGDYEGLDMDDHHLLDLGLGIIHKVI